MNDTLLQVIRQHSTPMVPRATDTTARLRRLIGIRAVLFDIYGTMLISGSGDVGTASAHDTPGAFPAALNALDVETAALPDDVGLEATIRHHHKRSHSQGIDFPEVDIVEVWRDTLEECARAGQLCSIHEHLDLRKLALEYECRVNPVWPMPNLENCLDAMSGQLELGIVSNAQFFTPLLFPALMMRTLEELGFDPSMQYFSYKFGLAKPSIGMFRAAAETLDESQISSAETLYVGNDMLNDIATAARAGMKTALFAGDARSLRLRQGDSRVSGYEPDLVLTDLSQLPTCIL